MTSGYQLKILGIPGLLNSEGKPARFRTKKQLALLLYLVLEARDRPVSRDVLIDLLWPDAPEKRARHSLSQGLTAIRERLGSDVLTRGGAAIRLTRRLETDLDRLLAGDAAGEVARPLEGLEMCGAAAFSHWVDGARVRCQNAMRQHFLEQVQQARSSGRMHRVHEQAARLYNVDPFSDTAAHALAERFLIEDDAVGAIRFLRSHLERTKGELECSPHPDLERLLRRLETGRIPLSRQDHRPPSVSQSRPEILVGREREFAQLEASWTDARGGQLKTFLVTGPAGIGKSSLVRRFAASVAARVWPVYTVACQEIGRSIPFAAVSDLIYALSRDPAVSGTDPLWLAEASRVTPGLRSAYPGVPEPQAAPAESVRLRVAEALQRMLEAVADGGPALLVFDDIQHMDPASRDVLHVLLRRIAGMPVCLIATVRTEEHQRLDLDGDESFSGFSWHSCADLVPLEPRQALEVVATLGHSTDALDESLRTKIAELAQGNPYLIEMLVSDWQRDPANSLVTAEMSDHGTVVSWRPPETMRRAFARQYRGLTPNAERLVNLLAVAGRAMGASEIASLLALRPTAVDQTTLEVIHRGVVRVDGVGYGFKNELHRAFVYYVMPDEVRKYHHRRIANTLSDPLRRRDEGAVLEASHHFAKAGMVGEAVQAVMSGAEFALSRGAANEAEQALGVVLCVCESKPCEAIHVLLTRAFVGQGKYQDALNTLGCCDTTALSVDDQLRASILRAEILHRGRLSDDETIRIAAQKALDAAMQSNNDAALMQAIQICAEVASESGDPLALTTLRTMAHGVGARARDTGARGLAQLTEGYCMLMSGKAAAALDAFSQCARALERAHRETDLRRALNGLGLALNSIGDFDGATAAWQHAARVAERIGDADAGSNAWSNLGSLFDDRGMFSASAKAYSKALGLASRTCSVRRSAEVYINAASLSLTLGNMDEAHELVQRASTFATKARLWRLAFEVMLAETDYYLATSNDDTAWVRFEEAQRLARGRQYGLWNVGRYERLRRHYAWRTQGFDVMQSMSREGTLPIRCFQIADQLEVRAFEEWVAVCEGAESEPKSLALKELMDRELLGVLATLISLGVRPTGIAHPRPEESAAELVSQILPNRGHQPIPDRAIDQAPL